MALATQHRCPDCGRLCESATELADHALYVHVGAPTPSAHIRRQRFSGLASKIAIAIAVLLSAGFWAAAFLTDWLEPEPAPMRPGSVVHRMAAELERSGEIDEFRSIEPDQGWDLEYELDGGAGYIRIRGERTRAQAVEYEAYGGDLQDAVEEVLRDHGFLLED